MTLQNKSFRCGRLRLRAADIAAILVFAAIAVCLFVSAPYGVTENDEALYQVYEFRLLQGDRLFYDDWTLTPFSTIFNFLPLAVYYTLTGSTAGVLLALRYFFAVCKLAAFAGVYCALRRRGFAAVMAAAVFTGAFAFGMKTLNYYFVCGCALLFTGWVLFVKENCRPVLYGIAGFVFSLAVLGEPSIAAIWVLYTALVLIRFFCRKKNARFLENYDPVLAPAVWRALFYGILAAAAALIALCAAFFMRAPIAGLRQGFLNALNDPERSNGLWQLLKVRFGIIGLYAQIYHPAAFAASFVLTAVSAAASRFYKKAEPVCIVLAAVLYAVLTVRMLTYPLERIGFAVGETVCHPLPLGLLSVAAYCFTQKKDRRLFAFLLLGFDAMICGDLISMTAFGAFSEVAAVPAVLLIYEYGAEVFARARNNAADQNGKRSRPREKTKGSRLLPATLAVLTVFMPLAEAAHGAYLLRLHEAERLFVQTDAPLDTAVASGALKGIVTTAEIAENYEKSVRDAGTVRAMCENRLYVADLAPAVYLDAAVPIAAHSPYYYYQEGWGRVSLWWEMHPEKRPDVIYIPFIKFSYMQYADASVEEKLAWLRENAEIEVTEGEIGLIVKVLRWHEQ